MARKPIRGFYSDLTGTFYATGAWRQKADGVVEVYGAKYDVTQDIARIIVERELSFRPVAATTEKDP
jgi:hypothetical protein